jgi:hypothetical protein
MRLRSRHVVVQAMVNMSDCERRLVSTAAVARHQPHVIQSAVRRPALHRAAAAIISHNHVECIDVQLSRVSSASQRDMDVACLSEVYVLPQISEHLRGCA